MSDTQRLGRLTENQLEQTVSNLEAELLELKSSAPQYVGGASILRVQSDTANTYDWSGNPPASVPSPTGVKRLQVSATAQHMTAFWGLMFIDLYVDSTSAKYTYQNAFNETYDSSGNLGYSNVTYSIADLPTTQANQRLWLITINSQNRARPVWVKCHVLGIDSATVVVTELN